MFVSQYCSMRARSPDASASYAVATSSAVTSDIPSPLRQPLGNGGERLRVPEERVDGVLVADVDLHLDNAAVADLVVRAVEGIKRRRLDRPVPAVNLDHRIRSELVEPNEVDLHAALVERGEERQDLVDTVLHPAKRVSPRQAPDDVGSEDFSSNRLEVTPVEAFIHPLYDAEICADDWSLGHDISVPDRWEYLVGLMHRAGAAQYCAEERK